ncbi:MAG: c-type cytochrome domain-containing protein, partial [Limisphaerales bacterium]
MQCIPQLLWPLILFSLIGSQVISRAQDFNRQIRPILASKCFTCHGPDKESRQAKLRLDRRDSAIAAEALVP